MNFVPARQDLDLYDEVWICPRNLVGPEVIQLIEQKKRIVQLLASYRKCTSYDE